VFVEDMVRDDDSCVQLHGLTDHADYYKRHLLVHVRLGVLQIT